MIGFKYIICILFFLISFVSCQNTYKPELNTSIDSLSYYLGVYTGHVLKDANIDSVNKDALILAINNMNESNELDLEVYKLADSIVSAIIKNKRNQKNLEEGRLFLANNLKRKEVFATESGLQYEIIDSGHGKKPNKGDSIKFLIHGKSHTGISFMNLNVEPCSMLLQKGTKGGVEALQLMSVGAKYRFFIPTELAYGLNPPKSGLLQPNMAIIYDVELLEVIVNK